MTLKMEGLQDKKKNRKRDRRAGCHSENGPTKRQKEGPRE